MKHPVVLYYVDVILSFDNVVGNYYVVGTYKYTRKIIK